MVKTSYGEQDYAKVYIQELVRLHGVPLSIITDRGAQFTFYFWNSFKKDHGTKAKFTTTFHPKQMDKMKEQCIH